jgi:hypothetical protein
MGTMVTSKLAAAKATPFLLAFIIGKKHSLFSKACLRTWGYSTDCWAPGGCPIH